MDKDELLSLMKKTLKAKGFTVYDSATETVELLEDALARAEQFIFNFCHICEMPDGLLYVWTDIACGFFLQDLYNTGRLDGVYGISGTVSSLKIGDTQVNYADGTASANARVLSIIDELTNGKRGDLLRYRRLCW